MRPKNKFENQGESIPDSCKTSNDVRCRDVGSENSTREEVGCGGNEDVKMDEWSHQAGQWYGHVLRREDEYVAMRVMGMEVPGKIRRGRPKRRWLDSIRNDLSERKLSGEDAQDRAKWRRLTRHIDPTSKCGKMRKKKFLYYVTFLGIGPNIWFIISAGIILPLMGRMTTDN